MKKTNGLIASGLFDICMENRRHAVLSINIDVIRLLGKDAFAHLGIDAITISLPVRLTKIAKNGIHRSKVAKKLKK